MSHPLHACWLKLKRADHHIRELHEAVEGFLDEEPYSTWFKPEVSQSGELGEIEIWGKQSLDPPAIEWGAIIGDAAHDLRSALDQLVWQLTLVNGKTPPREPMRKKSPWRYVAFPIQLKRRAKKIGSNKHPKQGPPVSWSERTPPSLWGVHPKAIAQIEAAQPFNRREMEDRRRHPLWLLSELNNIDKHRFVHLTIASTDLGEIKFPDVYGPDIKANVLWKRDPGPLIGDTHVATVEIVGYDPNTSPTPIPPEVYMNPKGTFDVSFEEGPPAYGGRIIETMERLYYSVQAILLSFDLYFS